MKVTTLSRGDRLLSPAGDVLITVESENNGIVKFHVGVPNKVSVHDEIDARELFGWTQLTPGNMPKGTEPEKREAFEDMAIPITGSPLTAAESLNAYFASGWSHVDLSYYPQGQYLAILRRRAVGLRPLVPEGR